jgi:hypothetical protein
LRDPPCEPLRELPWPEPDALRSPLCDAPEPDIPWLRELSGELSGEPFDELLLPLFLSFAIMSSWC